MVKFIRMISGEELLGVDCGTSSGRQVMEETIQLYADPSTGKVAFNRYYPYTDAHARVELNPQHITFIAEPAPELEAAYQQFLGKVIAPQKKLILPGS